MLGAAISIAAVGYWVGGQPVPEPLPPGATAFRIAHVTPVLDQDNAAWIGVLHVGDVVLDEGETRGLVRHVGGGRWDGWVLTADLDGPVGPDPKLRLAPLSPVPSPRG